MSEPCRFGHEEYDGARYCFEHAGFLEPGPFYSGSRRCDRAAVDAPFHCYPCARGDHGEHKTNAWEPDVPCECPPCTIPYQHGPHVVDDGRLQIQCPGGPRRLPR